MILVQVNDGESEACTLHAVWSLDKHVRLCQSIPFLGVKTVTWVKNRYMLRLGKNRVNPLKKRQCQGWPQRSGALLHSPSIIGDVEETGLRELEPGFKAFQLEEKKKRMRPLLLVSLEPAGLHSTPQHSKPLHSIPATPSFRVFMTMTMVLIQAPQPSIVEAQYNATI